MSAWQWAAVAVAAWLAIDLVIVVALWLTAPDDT